MKTVLLLFLFLFAHASFAQERETFDVATYTIPKGWKKVNNTENVVALAITNNQKGTYCQIAIYKTTISKGNLEADFKNEWAELIVKPYKTTENPTLVPKASENGWEVQGGSAPFEFSGGQSVAMLVTMSASGRCMSIVVVTNTTDYQPAIEKFLESVELKKAEVIASTEPPVSDTNIDGSIVGTWGKGASPNQKYDDYKRPYSDNNAGYQKDQYTFNSNGTYDYVSKTFRMTFDKILLVRENGSYQISGNSVTINPKKSVIEAWSKKDGTDKWGDLLTTQSRPLEKVTYTFTKHYFSGIQQWNLVLQAGKQTQRDGTFSSNTTFTNAWYFLPISATNTAVDLPGTEVTQKVEVVARTSGTDYQFSTSNFDDGWTSTVQEDWVQITKGNIVVLLHYGTNKIDVSSADHVTISNNAWNTLVAPRYSNLANYHVLGAILGYQRPSLISGDVTDNQTGARLHVSLFRKGGSNWIEIICPDKQSFINVFGVDGSKVDYYADDNIWNTLLTLPTYNKFAVSASDLTGKWSNDFSGSLQYVNVYTGADAGMTSHASNEKFEFGPGNTYKWNLGFASGQVGNLKFQSAKSNGTFSLPDNWQVTFSDIEGKPKTYNAHFSCVKGSRVLWLGETGYGRIE